MIFRRIPFTGGKPIKSYGAALPHHREKPNTKPGTVTYGGRELRQGKAVQR